MPTLAIPSDTSSVPLADYFFIVGVETSSIVESNANGNGNGAAPISPVVGATIQEDKSAEGADSTSRARPASDELTLTDESPQKLARFSWEPRKSVGSVIAIEPPATTGTSGHLDETVNRSSTATTQNGSSTLNIDFDKALRSFVSERDTFLEDIQFSAGQLAQPNRPRPRPKTQRITSEDTRDGGGGVSGLRRRLSTMNPLSRSSTSVRRSSARNSKRLSGYNSVIPAPQRFKPPKNMHPLKRPYEPVLLDQYPSKHSNDKSKERVPFPDYVPMFVFPNDVNVVSSDERPRTTWHGFAMTGSDNVKLYGMCIITWMPLHNDAAAELEWQCEQWRNKHMSSEEREMAKDLGERLASERTKLSELLAELPHVRAGSPEREAHEEEITATEDRISLIADALRPVRHGAASRIAGLTDSETGFWIPRAYGVLGRDAGLTSFWKEWLRAVVVPMTNGQVLHVPPSSPRVGSWQPMERYVINLCAEAPSPLTSITQIELAVRDLRLYARKEAVNEIPGSRNTDLFSLFRCLDVPDVVVLFEYILAESRVILLSSHTAMLHLASSAITQLLYPLKWAGIFIPVLPARLIQALEAPCPYIVGIERRYESVELPEDDFVLVDLDNGVIEATNPPVCLPRAQRRKLISVLQLAAPHRYRFGVSLGPPKYATEAYPFDIFSSENPTVFNAIPPSSHLAYLANLTSSSFGSKATSQPRSPPLFNAFSHPKTNREGSADRPNTTASITSARTLSPPSPKTSSPILNNHLPPPLPGAPPPVPVPRSDSGHSLQASLREKRSGYFNENNPVRRNSSFGLTPSTNRRPSIPMPMQGPSHASTTSVSTLATEAYAPSVYAQSTIAASTIMPEVLMQPVRESDTQIWTEGHCLIWRSNDSKSICHVCDEPAEEGIYKCSGCAMHAHVRCARQICVVCPAAFYPDQVMAAFVRCFASLFYTYRKYLSPATAEQKKSGLLYRFNMDGFLRSVPRDNADYMGMLRHTQIFNEFISERETKPPTDPSIRLFDEVILSKRNRGRSGYFSKSSPSFLQDTGDHLWRTAAAPVPTSRVYGAGAYQHSSASLTSTTSEEPPRLTGRMPAKLDPQLMREPRVVQGVVLPNKAKPKRKELPLPSSTLRP